MPENQDSAEPDVAPTEASRSSWNLAAVALALPVLAGVAMLFVTRWQVSLGISAATVIATAFVLAIDLSRLAKRDRSLVASLLTLVLGMLALWIVVYPLAFFQRRRYGGPALGLPAVAVAAFFTVSPFVSAWVGSSRLPACDSSEVIGLLHQILPGPLAGANLKSLEQIREIRFDKGLQVRYGECLARTDAGDLPVQFQVEWQDPTQSVVFVRIVTDQLPACDSPPAKMMLVRLLNGSTPGAGLESVSDHREQDYDSVKEIRTGTCVFHRDQGDSLVRYIISWQNKPRGEWTIRLVPSELPSCDSPEVVTTIARILQANLTGAKLTAIDGHRETRFDAAAAIRYGECLVHTERGDMAVAFTVEWQDRETGLFQVKIAPARLLPECDSAPVQKILADFLQTHIDSAKLESIDGHRELRFDPEANVRRGTCVVHTDKGDFPLEFVVEWQDHERGVSQVRVLQ